MGCSWWSYIDSNPKEDLIRIDKGAVLLIPKYAKKWVGTDKLIVESSGEYSSFSIIYKGVEKSLNGHLLIGVFMNLFENTPIEVTFEECLFDGEDFPYKNEYLEDLRTDGIFNEDSLDFGLKFVYPNEAEEYYEDIGSYSYCGQF